MNFPGKKHVYDQTYFYYGKNFIGDTISKIIWFRCNLFQLSEHSFENRFLMYIIDQ